MDRLIVSVVFCIMSDPGLFIMCGIMFLFSVLVLRTLNLSTSY